MPRPDQPSVNAGRSIIDIIWEELDEIMDRLMMDGAPEFFEAIDISGVRNEGIGHTEEWQYYGEQRGQAQGVAYCLAVLLNPYDVQVDYVREQAMARWEARNADDQ